MTKNFIFAVSRATLLAGLFLFLTSPAFSVDGMELLKKADEQNNFETMSYSATMEIRLGKESRTKKMKGTVSGNRAFMEFLNPEDCGVRYLKIEGNMWIYSPKEGKSVKISGHLLKEGIMGSDLSYEDAMNRDLLSGNYSVELLGEERLADRPAAILYLEALAKGLPYEKRKLWIDTERYVILREEMYAKSGRLLKTSTVQKVQRLQDRWTPTALEMKNELRKNSSTIFVLENISYGAKVDESLFLVQNLGR
ncbi:hypothetical protein MASR2M29_24240 [Spirochaetota bacterium]